MPLSELVLWNIFTYLEMKAIEKLRQPRKKYIMFIL